VTIAPCVKLTGPTGLNIPHVILTDLDPLANGTPRCTKAHPKIVGTAPRATDEGRKHPGSLELPAFSENDGIPTESLPTRDRNGLGYPIGEVQIVENIDQWYGPDYCYFKIKANDGHLYILRFDEARAEWALTMFQSPARSTHPPSRAALDARAAAQAASERALSGARRHPLPVGSARE